MTSPASSEALNDLGRLVKVSDRAATVEGHFFLASGLWLGVFYHFVFLMFQKFIVLRLFPEKNPLS